MVTLQDLRELTVNIFEDPIIDNQNAYIPFAFTEYFLMDINKNPNNILLYFWPMEKTVILGMMDKRVPYLDNAKGVIENYGYTPFVRNIGGLAVVADLGVLNFSILIPDRFENKLTINDGYLIMVNLIRNVFNSYNKNIEHFEIVNSYCPGKFDLSIGGKKFAGMAQRRVKKGIVVSIYISVCGDQNFRGNIVSDFYKAGFKGQTISEKYPNVDPTCMANISDLLKTKFTVNEVIFLIKSTFEKMGFVVNENILGSREDILKKLEKNKNS